MHRFIQIVLPSCSLPVSSSSYPLSSSHRQGDVLLSVNIATVMTLHLSLHLGELSSAGVPPDAIRICHHVNLPSHCPGRAFRLSSIIHAPLPARQSSPARWPVEGIHGLLELSRVVFTRWVRTRLCRLAPCGLDSLPLLPWSMFLPNVVQARRRQDFGPNHLACSINADCTRDDQGS